MSFLANTSFTVNTPSDLFFYFFAALACVFSLSVVLARSAITSAFSLVLVFFSIAATFALLDAHFLAAIQILVYTGAVMVLFVFVVMLLNADMNRIGLASLKSQRWIRGLLGAVVSLAAWYFLVLAIKHGEFSNVLGGMTSDRIQELGGNVQVLSEVLFSDFILPFELTSVLLLVGIVGSVILAKRAKAKSLNGPKGAQQS